jgi:hypothetical protein
VSTRLGTVVGIVALVAPVTACSKSATVPTCDDAADRAVVLIAQSVPSATLIPCVGVLPAGWTFSGSMIAKDHTRLWLDSTLAGVKAVELDLTATCEPGAAPEILPAPDEVGAHVYESPTSLDPFAGTRYIVFDGGCVRYRYSFASGVQPSVALEVDEALSFIPRADVAAAVEAHFDQTLCGVGAPPCEGS